VTDPRYSALYKCVHLQMNMTVCDVGLMAVQAIVAARELAVGSSLSDETVDALNAMSELQHPSILRMLGVANPSSVPTLVSTMKIC